jgi:hypothetical protein
MQDMTDQPSTAIAPSVLRFIHTAKSRLLFTEQEYRALLKEHYGIGSSKELSPAQADDLMNFFRQLGFSKKKRKYTCLLCAPREKKQPIPAGTIYPVKPTQLAVIDEMQKAVKWRRPDGFARWLLRYFGIDKVTTSLEASRVIAGLKGVLRSQLGKCTACSFAPRLKGQADEANGNNA